MKDENELNQEEAKARINEKMAAVKIDIDELAKRIDYNAKSLSLILRGSRKLTLQLYRHIMLELEGKRVHAFVYTFSLPDGVVETFVPSTTTLTEKERQQALLKIAEHNLGELLEKYKARDLSAGIESNLRQLSVAIEIASEEEEEEERNC